MFMRLLLIFLLFSPLFAYSQSEESRLLFLAINSKRSEIKTPKLSYASDNQTVIDTRAVVASTKQMVEKDTACHCSTESIFTAKSFKELVSFAIDEKNNWDFLNPKERNATVSVIPFDGIYYAVVRTY